MDRSIFRRKPQIFLSSMEAVRAACSNGLDVTEAHHQLVSLISTLELEKQMAAILDFRNRLWIKKLETALFVFFVNLRSEKLQVSKIYMKS